MKEYKIGIITYIFICICMSISSLISPYIIGNFVDQLISSDSISFIYRYICFFLTINFISIIIGYYSGVLYVKLQSKIGYSINRDFIQKFLHLPLSYINKQDTVYLNQRINNDSNSLVIFCIGIIQNVLVNLVMIVVPITIMVSFNLSLAIVLISIAVVYYITYLLYKKKLYKVNLQYKEDQSRFFSKLNEQVQNAKFIKLHSMFSSFFQRLNKSFGILLSSALKFQKVNYVFSGLDKIVLMIAQIILLLMGGHAIIRGHLTIGKFTIMSSYFNMMLGATRYFFGLGQTIQENLVSFNRLDELRNLSLEPNGDIVIDSVSKIELMEVSFKYDDTIIIDNMSLCLSKGKIHIICGDNGTGKSTLLYIIIGMQIGNYSGQVYYNDIAMNEIDMYTMRKQHIGISDQEPSLFTDTISYNIHLDNSLLNEQKDQHIDTLSNMLGLDSFINSLPQNLDTIVNEHSSNLSGGEKQKISILRAFAKNPDVLILDEPTSALDNDSRTNLRRYLNEIKAEKIIIIVTHDFDFIDKEEDIIVHLC